MASSSRNLKRDHSNGVLLWCNVSEARTRPLVPLNFRRPVIDALHGLSHGGTRPTIKLICSRFVWPGIRQDIRRWCRTCLPCQRSKTSHHVKIPTTILPPASHRFGSIHVDLVGPLPDSHGHRYLLTIVDCFSRWPEAYPLVDMSSKASCEAFIHQWLPRFGIPDDIITDRGSQFVSGTWKEMMSALGIKTLSTTAYHPQCNGLVEQMHRQ